MNLNKYFAYAKEKGFSDVEFKISKSNSLSIGVFHGKVESYSVAENETVSIRGIFNGNEVAGSTENLNDIYTTLDNMALLAPVIEDRKEVSFFEGSEKYLRKKKCSDALLKVSTKDKIALLLDLEKKAYAYDPRIKDVERVSYREGVKSLTLVNSKGLKLSYTTTNGALIVGLVAKSETDTRTNFNYEMFSSLEDVNIDKFVAETCDGALSALDGTQCASKKYKTLLDRSVASTLLGAFLSNVSGDAVNKGKSLLKDKLNDVVASSKITITEDPNVAKYPFIARTFDDEGVATYKKEIVKNGVLKTFLYNREAAKIAGVASTGNGYGSRGGIGVDTNYVEVKPGKLDKNGIAAKIGNGIYITDVAGTHAGMNPMSGDFSLQASGYLIENGKITTPVNLITIAGNLFTLVKEVKEVGNDNKLGMGGLSCPCLYVKSLAVSGK